MSKMVRNEIRDLRREIMQEADRTASIRSATLELLDFCNFSCSYCYVKESYRSVIPKADALRILQELKDEGCIWLLLTGGEPFLHPNFSEIYLYAYRLGFRISVFTNGSLLSEQLCDLFQKYPPEVLEITLYGYNRETYDNFVSTPGAFERFDRNIDMLCKYDIKPVLKFTLTTANVGFVDKLKNYCYKKKLKYRYDDLVIPRIDNHNNDNLHLRLCPQVAHQNMMKDGRYIRSLAEKTLAENTKKTDNRLYTCSAGKNSVVIDARLRMYVCILERRFWFDLRSNAAKIKDGQKYLLSKMTGYLEKGDSCFECKYKPFCRYCPARFAVETGDERTPPRWYCEYGQIMYNTLVQLTGKDITK